MAEWDESKHPRDEIGRWATIKGHLKSAAKVTGAIALVGAASAAGQFIDYKMSVRADEQRKRAYLKAREDRARYDHQVHMAINKIATQNFEEWKKQEDQRKAADKPSPQFYNTEEGKKFLGESRLITKAEKEAMRIAAADKARYENRGFYDYSRDKKK